MARRQMTRLQAGMRGEKMPGEVGPEGKSQEGGHERHPKRVPAQVLHSHCLCSWSVASRPYWVKRLLMKGIGRGEPKP